MPGDHRVDAGRTAVGGRTAVAGRAASRLRRIRPATVAGDAAAVLVAVALATAAVGALQSTAPPDGLEVLYLPAVMLVAIRRGELPALVAAVVSVLVVNWFFVPPHHRLLVARSQDVVELVVLMLAAAVVGRLAATARQRTAEAERRAALAAARERESALLAEVASAILGGEGIATQLGGIGARIARAVGADHARVAMEPVPSPAPGELVQSLRTRTRPAWLYVAPGANFPSIEIERLAEPLGGLIDVAVERERMAEQAAQAEAASQADSLRRAVLHAISHDLRSPLTAIATAGAALRGPVSADEHAMLVNVIDSESTRLAKLVNDLLDLSKIEAGATAPQTDWCDLHDVVAAALVALHTTHPVQLALPEELPLVRADGAQLERVFSNLIENAVKFSPPSEAVTVTGGTGGGNVTVRVIDHGPGIPAAERPHVFEPFFRGQRRRGAGSGLGLAIGRGFVEANGGRIALSSGGGRGTAFAVTFPAAGPPPLQERTWSADGVAG